LFNRLFGGGPLIAQVDQGRKDVVHRCTLHFGSRRRNRKVV
jgi:hypothetical protein